MKLTTRTRYGTRALLDLAMHSQRKPVQLKEIANRQSISLHYLEHLITPLVAAGIIKSLRGSQGGVLLAKSPKEIRLSDVVELLEGSIAPVECTQSPEVCDRSKFCATRDIWGELAEAIKGVLEATTLQDLVERQQTKKQPADMYSI